MRQMKKKLGSQQSQLYKHTFPNVNAENVMNTIFPQLNLYSDYLQDTTCGPHLTDLQSHSTINSKYKILPIIRLICFCKLNEFWQYRIQITTISCSLFVLN
uniref:Uncharacterized protein n=1 Tax=Trichobilharzia regenti TaxID=157069 RepID=A0AA85KEV7_TRIRE|nr:unnamed protein product [Trichobilharzia regenti]